MDIFKVLNFECFIFELVDCDFVCVVGVWDDFEV